MPARTNDFQQLIATAYRQIVATNGTVTESAMVRDKHTGTLREVDILIEHRAAHHDFRVMIECRDRARKDSVAWIEEIIGKAMSLAVDKIVAVSNSGFTAAAKKKASANGIETLLLERALETDWSAFPCKPGIALVTDETLTLKDVHYLAGSGFRPLSEIGLEATAFREGKEVGPVKEYCIMLFHQRLPELHGELKKLWAALFLTLDDLKKELVMEWECETPNFSVTDARGEDIKIPKLKFLILGKRQVAEVAQQHHKFNGLMLSTGEHFLSEDLSIRFYLTQDPETKQLHGRWQTIPK